jgi:hypothetical protein
MPYQRSHNMYFREVTATRRLSRTTHTTNVKKDLLPASLWTIVAALLIWGFFYLVTYWSTPIIPA